jgi:hypothetical protein
MGMLLKALKAAAEAALPGAIRIIWTLSEVAAFMTPRESSKWMSSSIHPWDCDIAYVNSKVTGF